MPSTGRKVLLPIFIQIVNFSAFCQPLLLEKQWYCSEIFTKVASGIWQHGQKFSGNSDKNYCGPVVMGVAVIPKFTTEKSCYCPLSCSLATFLQFASPLLPQKQWYCPEIFRNTAHTIWECVGKFLSDSSKNWVGCLLGEMKIFGVNIWPNVASINLEKWDQLGGTYGRYLHSTYFPPVIL